MYISNIKIIGFRNFKNHEIEFNDGVNVVIGNNNSGKTNLLKALALVIDNVGNKRLGIDDFYKGYTLAELQANPPEVKIAVTFKQSSGEDAHSEDLAVVGDWLTSLVTPYEATWTYTFSLPGKYREAYIMETTLVPGSDVEEKKKVAFSVLQREYLRKYVVQLVGGTYTLQQRADRDSLEKFDFQFLDAIRDVERDMFTGRNTLLRDVIRFFLDYEIRKDSSLEEDDQRKRIEDKRKLFQKNSTDLVGQLLERMEAGSNEILGYAAETGASSFNNAKPGFEGNLLEEDLFATLRLIIRQTDFNIPATHNGLGYNNLIYISLLLAKMQVDSDGEYLDSNAKIFPVLAIEEPEAHLHPAMQYKFLTFLKKNKGSKVRQVFVTSHSTHITSAVSLDEIICLHSDGTNVHVAYPGSAFPLTDEGRKSKAYVQRFLDATKSEMLFAKNILMVEGLAEQLLLPILSQYESKSLEDEHVAIVNIGGRYFRHFLYLFDTQDSPKYALPKKVSCITDRDPERRMKSSVGGAYSKCYPFEYDTDTECFDYKTHGPALENQYANHPNIRFFTQNEKGKTLEYTIAWFNPYSELLITDSISNKDELKKLIDDFQAEISLSDLIAQLRNSAENTRLSESLSQSQWEELENKKALFAARYLSSVQKGENSLELAFMLSSNLKDGDKRSPFNVPTYIKNAIDWICQ